MPNIKSAIKRTKQNEKRRLRNKAVKTNVKSRVRKVTDAAAKNTVDEARAALVEAIRALEKAGSKGVMPKKTVSRKVGRLVRRVNALSEKAEA